MIDGLR